MSLLYISESGATVGLEGNRLTVKYKDGMVSSYPAEAVEGITLMGAVQVTAKCVQHCLASGVPVSYFSKGGRYFGRLMSTGHAKAALQRRQSALYESAFALELSKRLIRAKIGNQLVVLRRYARSREVDISQQERQIIAFGKKVAEQDNIPSLMGYEGQAAKEYFAGLALCIEEEFRFHGRNRRPPRDPFNSLISLGYSILMNECYSEIENRGLNPYFGFMHRDGENHPTLASDLMEEWRAVLVDSLAMSMINGHELLKDHFVTDVEEPGCFLTREGLKKYLNRLEEKLRVKVQYLKYVDFPVSFRQAIAKQTASLAEAIEQGDAERYEPIRIR